MDPTIFVNPACSKCRTAQGILRDAGVDTTEIRYLDTPPTVDDLRTLMSQLGITDGRDMIRTGEAVYTELGLAAADGDRLLEAIAAHPILLERPIFVRDGRAVIGRPPERILDLL